MLNIKNSLLSAIFVSFLLVTIQPVFSQKGFSFNIPKPKEFSKRKLRSEKTETTRFTLPTRIIQNTTTHYNYYYNAYNKFKDVMTTGKSRFMEDYSLPLIPFYNYTLDLLLQDTVQIDSVLYKAQSGIALHDLRSNWTDDMYMLWGIAYHLQKQYDSAYLMFQFINHAYAPRDKNGYYRAVGSSRDGQTNFSIVTKESKNLVHKAFYHPPRRNDAFLWQIRNYLWQNKLIEASTLIQALRDDVYFPKRLKKDLSEMEAFYYYKTQNWDSTIVYLEAALGNAETKTERARWEYLLAQLNEKTGNYEAAQKWYSKTVRHTTDLMMEMNARLASVKADGGNGPDALAKNIAALLKMAKKSQYDGYQDIIYYMAGQMEMQRKNIDNAFNLFKKATQYNPQDIPQRDRAFLYLADISLQQKKFRQAYNYYDSINPGDPFLKDPEGLRMKKTSLKKIVDHVEIIERQDSMQKLAAMPEEDRKTFVNKLLSDINKDLEAKSKKLASSITTTSDPFSNKTKSDWYFHNEKNRVMGGVEFKKIWGDRPNTDNWRLLSKMGMGPQGPVKNGAFAIDEEKFQPVKFEDLYNRIPLTETAMNLSNDSLKNSLLSLGLIYIQEFEDCESGIETLTRLTTQFPDNPSNDLAYFNMQYCYRKAGNITKADELKNLLSTKFPNSAKTQQLINTGRPSNMLSVEDATAKEYDRIYDLFLSGNFLEAVEKKKNVETVFGPNKWSPQLSYIEAVYYIKTNDVNNALGALTSIITKHNGTKLADRARTLLDVLNRKTDIENELVNLVIPKYKEDSLTAPILEPIKKDVVPEPVKKDTVVTQPVVVPEPVKKDTVVTKPVVVPEPVKKDTAVAKPVVVPEPVKKDTVVTKPVVVPEPVKKYTVVAKPVVVPEPVKKDTVVLKPEIVTDTVKKQMENILVNNAGAKEKENAIAKKDSAQVKAPDKTRELEPTNKPVVLNNYVHLPKGPHYVFVLLNNVDPIYVREAQNAFNRYNQDNYAADKITSSLETLNNTQRILVLGTFKDAAAAMEYVDIAKPITSAQIVPWLKNEKYFYYIISEASLEKLKQDKKIEEYVEFLKKAVPGKFD